MLNGEDADYKICLQIIPDEDDPHAYLSAFDANGEQLAKIKVRPDFKLNQTSAMKWLQQDFARID